MLKRWFAVLVVVAVGAAWLAFTQVSARYCWLVFGPEGKTRLLAKVQRGRIQFDSHFQGTYRLEDFSRLTLGEAGENSYAITGLQRYDSDGADHLMIHVEIRGARACQQYADVALGRSRRTAGIAHFDGPLRVQAQTSAGRLPAGLALQRGEKPTDIRALVGTVDLGKGCWTVVRSHYSANQRAFPTNVYPMVDVEFPSQKPGGPPLKVRYPLDQFC